MRITTSNTKQYFRSCLLTTRHKVSINGDRITFCLFKKVTQGTIRTALLFTHEALQGGHDSEFFGRGSLDTFHRTIQEEWEARCKGLAEFRRHEHVPFVLFIVAIGDDEKVFLEDVRGLALLANHIGIIASSYKLG